MRAETQTGKPSGEPSMGAGGLGAWRVRLHTGVMNGERLAANLQSLRERMAAAARRAGREPSSVRLVAVTKRTPVAWARELIRLGQVDLGENYPQHLWQKAAEVAVEPGARWHLIGHLQTNKVRRTLPLVWMMHGVDSWRLLRAVDDEAARHTDRNEPLRVLLQVNVSGEASKHGWEPEAIEAEADRLATQVRHVSVVGLMGMAALQGTPPARDSFRTLRELRDRLRARTGLGLEELSMGMSEDFEVAIEEGATWVRVGSSLFEGLVPG